MRHFEIAILQVRHPTLIKRSAAVAAIGLLLLLALCLTWWSRRDRPAAVLVGLWGISSEIVAPEKTTSAEKTRTSATSTATAPARYAFDFKDTPWMVSKTYTGHFIVPEDNRRIAAAPKPKKETPDTSLAFVPVGYIVVELMEAEAQAADEARAADPSFGKNYRQMVGELKARYHDGIRLEHDITPEQLAAVYRLALDGTARPRGVPKKAT